VVVKTGKQVVSSHSAGCLDAVGYQERSAASFAYDAHKWSAELDAPSAVAVSAYRDEIGRQIERRRGEHGSRARGGASRRGL
jgi:hypothetical protein